MADSNMTVNINDERAVRLKKLEDLYEQGINPYPARVTRKQEIQAALAEPAEAEVAVAGRIMLKRDMGKLTFCRLQDESGQMQIALQKDKLEADVYKRFVKKVDVGDIIAVQGTRFVTHKGEESILVSDWQVLSKALLPLPDKFHGLHDEEARYRKRYLDLLLNTEEKNKMLVRSKIVWSMRTFLHNKGFVEVETPMLETVASGAMARTFDTHLHAYDLPVHLRICIGELWQKRLLVAGFEKTFEIGRAFRNEGVDRQHNPEFTMIEYYWAFADYEDNMRLHEEMIPAIIQDSIGILEIEHDGHTINFEGPYPRVTFQEVVLEHSGIDINQYDDVESLRAAMEAKGYDTEGITERGKLMDSLYKQTARPKIIQPTFVLNYPVELKPLAKKAADPRYTEMFQLIVSGFELSNSYTELNDPVDQRNRFEEQAQNKAEGDDEAMAYDRDYVDALEHGMPPATGTGIGIDRFVALITGSHTLREITMFPLMKPIQEQATGKNKKAKTMAAHAVILDTPEIPNWSKLNAAAHLSAALAAREGKKLIEIESSTTTDGEEIPMNIRHAIMMKSTDSQAALRELKRKGEEAGLVVTCFTEEMRDSSNDVKVKEKQEAKSSDEIQFLGVLVYGSMKEVKGLTEGFGLVD